MREGRGKETEEEKGSRGRGGKQGCRGGGRESRQQSTRLKDLGKQRRREGEQRRRDAYQAEGEVPDRGVDNSGRSCRRPMGAQTRGRAGADGRWLQQRHATSRRCGRPELAAGTEERASGKPQADGVPPPPRVPASGSSPSLSLSLRESTRTRG